MRVPAAYRTRPGGRGPAGAPRRMAPHRLPLRLLLLALLARPSPANRLHSAAQRGDTEAVAELLGSADKSGIMPNCDCWWWGLRCEVCAVDDTHRAGLTPAMYAAAHGHAEILRRLSNAGLTAVKSLVPSPSPAKAAADGTTTPLPSRPSPLRRAETAVLSAAAMLGAGPSPTAKTKPRASDAWLSPRPMKTSRFVRASPSAHASVNSPLNCICTPW